MTARRLCARCGSAPVGPGRVHYCSEACSDRGRMKTIDTSDTDQHLALISALETAMPWEKESIQSQIAAVKPKKEKRYQ